MKSSPSSSASSASTTTTSSATTTTTTSNTTEGSGGMTCATASASASAPTIGNTSSFCNSSCPSSSSENSSSAATSEAELQSLLTHLSTQFVAATKHHLSLGALHYQRCTYRSSTEHYQRAINFLMRREDAFVRYGPDALHVAATASSDASDAALCASIKIKEELLVEMEKMEFYIYVLCLNNAADMDLLRRKQRQPVQTQPGVGMHQVQNIRPAAAFGATGTKRPRRATTTTNTTTTNTTTARATRATAANLPPPRLAFYLDEADASYILDSHLRAHRVATASTSTTAANISQDHQQQTTATTTSTTIHLLKAYVMYNLALCHVTLGSYAESLNLLQMVIDDDDGCNTANDECSSGGSGCDGDAHIIRPAELGDIMAQYQSFVRGVVVAANNGSASSPHAAATAAAMTLSPSSSSSSDRNRSDDDMDVDRDHDVGDNDADDLLLPASSA